MGYKNALAKNEGTLGYKKFSDMALPTVNITYTVTW